MPLIDRSIHKHAIFCYLLNPNSMHNDAEQRSPYNYHYRHARGRSGKYHSVMVGIMDRFSSNAGFMLHIGPDSGCQSFVVTDVPGFTADENAHKVALQYQWFTRNPSVVTGLKESILSFLDNASKSDINLTAAFANVLGLYSTILGKLFGADDNDVETFRQTIGFIAYIFQQGKAIVQEKDILSFAGMQIPENQFSFSKTYITLAANDNLTSVEMAIKDANRLKLFPSIAGFVKEDVKENQTEIVKLIASIIMSFYISFLRNITCNRIYERHIDKDGNPVYSKIFSNEVSAEEKVKIIERVGLKPPENKEYINLTQSGVKILKATFPLPQAGRNFYKVEENDNPIYCIYKMLASTGQPEEAPYTKELLKWTSSNGLASPPNNLLIKLHKNIISKVSSKKYSSIGKDEKDTRILIPYSMYTMGYKTALHAPYFVLTNLVDAIRDKNNGTDNSDDTKTLSVILGNIRYIGFEDDTKIDANWSDIIDAVKTINKAVIYKMPDDMELFNNLVSEAVKYIDEKMAPDNFYYIVEEEFLGKHQIAIYLNVKTPHEEPENIPYTYEEGFGKLLEEIDKRLSAIRVGAAQEKVLEFLDKFGVLIVKPPGGYHFIHDYKAIVAGIVLGKPCVKFSTTLEGSGMEEIEYKIAYYGFAFRNIFRNLLGVADYSSNLSASSIMYMIPTKIAITTSETFTYSPMADRYGDSGVPTWTKMEITMAPMNNYIFFFGNYSDLTELFVALDLEKMLANEIRTSER